MRSSLSEKEISKPQQTGTKKTDTNKFVGTLIVAGAVALFGVTAPFWHMFFDNQSTGEIFGFTNAHRFLYAFGTIFSMFTCAAHVFWMGHLLDPSYHRIRRVSNIIGGCYMFSASYFLLWIFWSLPEDFPPEAYYTVMVVISVVMTIAIYTSIKFTVRLFRTYHQALKSALEWILDIRNRIIPEFAFMAHRYKEKVPSAKYREEKEEEIRSKLKEFEQDNDKVLMEITDNFN